MKVILDLSLLPAEYKALKTAKKQVEKYEKDFGVKVIPIDASKQNLGASSYVQPIIVNE